MNEPEIFRPRTPTAIDALVARHPLALVISAGGGRLQASPLPLVMQRDADGVTRFIGHFSRHNPQVAALRADPRALIAFSGAQGYISSTWLRDRRNAPTWNYEVAHFEVDIFFDDSPEGPRRALQTLVDHLDADEAEPWRLEEAPRLEFLSQHIAPFVAVARGVQAQFKLGQGETPDVLEDSLAGLVQHDNLPLARAMARLHGMSLPSA